MTPFEEIGPIEEPWDAEDAIAAMEDIAEVRRLVPPGVTINSLVALYTAVHANDVLAKMRIELRQSSCSAGDAITWLRRLTP